MSAVASRSPRPPPPPPSTSADAPPVTYFDISQLPSVRDGSMTSQEEAVRRRKTCRFIEEAGRLLKLPRVAVSTAMVFFHRFYAKHSFNEHDRFEVAVASIMLAAKTEESPKKLTTVISECHKLKHRGMQAANRAQAQRGAPSTPSPTSAATPVLTGTGVLDPKGEEFIKLKERILLLERVILHTIGFELSIDHPYKFFVEQIKKMTAMRKVRYRSTPASKGPTTAEIGKLMNELVQYSMSFANDSMHTSLCLQFSPQEIASACIYLAGQFAKAEPIVRSNGANAPEANESGALSPRENAEGWLQILGQPNPDAIASICLQLLELISERKSVDRKLLLLIHAQINDIKSSDGNGGEGKQKPPPPPKSASPNVKRSPPPSEPPPDAKRPRV